MVRDMLQQLGLTKTNTSRRQRRFVPQMGLGALEMRLSPSDMGPTTPGGLPDTTITITYEDQGGQGQNTTMTDNHERYAFA